MRAIYFVGILAFFLITVSTANAGTTFSITDNNIYEQNNDIPDDASIKVDVTYNGDTNTITFEDKSDRLTNPRITWVAYNLDADAEEIEGYGGIQADWGELPNDEGISDPVITVWSEKNNFGALGDFDNFHRVYAIKNPNVNNQFTKVVVKLPEDENYDFDGIIRSNKFGYQVGVHFVCDQFSCFVAGHPPETPIPEFPSVVLPVAAIMGILLISQNRKKER